MHELPDGPHLLPRRLQTAGYSTGYTGKWHLGTERGQSFYGQQTPSLPSTMGFEGEDFEGLRQFRQKSEHSPAQLICFEKPTLFFAQ